LARALAACFCCLAILGASWRIGDSFKGGLDSYHALDYSPPPQFQTLQFAYLVFTSIDRFVFGK
jgi:hypothetical protein